MKKGTDVPKVMEADTFLKAVNEVNNKRLGVTAVLNKRGALSGAITDGDIRRFILKNQRFQEAKASDAMTKNPKVIKQTDSLEHALSTMEKFKITTMFVVGKKNELVGTLHIHDIIESSLA
jgi:arabinose-5-phosphate isomerase